MLAPNAPMVFTDYEVIPTGLKVHFVCPAPGPGNISDYYIQVTDAELAAVTNWATLEALFLEKLRKQERKLGYASNLDALLGRTIILP